jgi:hypothetical protein
MAAFANNGGGSDDGSGRSAPAKLPSKKLQCG